MKSARSIGVVLFAGVMLAAVPLTGPRPPRPERATGLGRAFALSTARHALDETIAAARRRVAADPGDGEAAVLLADALMRGARVRADASLPVEAERALRAALRHQPSDYPARRMLGVILLSQHRFAAALEASRAASAMRPGDAWNFAVAGDALLELGRYEEAFASFDRMMALRPDAAAYARVAYARELQGDLDGAVAVMKMAAEGTGAHDPEAQAWTSAQLGNLYLLQGRLDAAERQFGRAEFAFPSHPYAQAGRVHLLIARQRFADALALAQRMPETPERFAVEGDLLARLGQAKRAEAAYAASERLEREGWEQEEPQPAALARFLAERNRSHVEAVRLAESAAAQRQDIYTLDALAWANYRAGRLADASKAIASALRTGTRDRRIRCHAAAIADALATTSGPAAGACPPL